MRLTDHGLAVDIPRGWEARMFVPDLPPPAINLPVLHVSSAPLPTSRSSYAAEASRGLGDRGILFSLLEFEAALANVGLYAAQGMPVPIRADELDHRAMQIPHPEQGGVQRFFSQAGRAFSLYVIAGLGPGLRDRLGELDRVLRGVEISSTVPGA